MAAKHLSKQITIERIYNTYHNIVSNTKIVPENAWIEGIDKDVGFLV